MRIGLMVWEIGERSFLEQFGWAAANGFDEIAFHTNPKLVPRRGVDPEALGPETLAELGKAAAPFAHVDIHAPFDLVDETLAALRDGAGKTPLQALEPTLRLAERLGARTVTLHPPTAHSGIDGAERQRLFALALGEIDARAGECGVEVGVEATGEFGTILGGGFRNVGVTVDVGHLSFHGGAAYRSWGSLGGLIRHLGEAVVHVHVHDYDGERDHIPVGAGGIDFPDVLTALEAIGYGGALCLELAPSPTLEADYIASRERLGKLLA